MKTKNSKRTFRVVLILAGLMGFTGCLMVMPYDGPYDETDYSYNPPMDTSYFYDTLADYGSWVYWPGYDYVWVPFDAGYGGRPYSDGRWVWTDYGWTWISYEHWGWIVYHYGRWVFEPGFGWFWVPDTVWGPAWVCWRTSDSWIGWSPLPPRFRYGHRHGLILDQIDLANDWWIFVNLRNFTSDHLSRHVLGRDRNAEFVSRTMVTARIVDREGRPSNIGFGKDRIERLTRTSIPTFTLQDGSRPEQPRVDSGRVVIYRPDVASKPSAKPEKFSTREARDVRKSGAASSKSSRVDPPQPRTVTAAPQPAPQAVEPETRRTIDRGSSRLKTVSDNPRPESGRSVKEVRVRSEEKQSRAEAERTSPSKVTKSRERKAG